MFHVLHARINQAGGGIEYSDSHPEIAMSGREVNDSEGEERERTAGR
jgi:hypothetical protein